MPNENKEPDDAMIVAWYCPFSQEVLPREYDEDGSECWATCGNGPHLPVTAILS